MNLVAIVLYDRYENLNEWIRCWQMSRESTPNTQLVVIHNYIGPIAMKNVKRICQAAGVVCVSRRNVGMDIGAFQDVCRQRLKGFPDFDKLLWCTDDCWPMRPTFVHEMFEPFTDGKTAIIGLEMAYWQDKPHIRTTCFAIRKKHAVVMKFPADPIKTKDECYQFEHRHKHAIYEQGMEMGGVLWYNQLRAAPLWDTGHRGGFNLYEEHYKNFPQ